MTEAPFTGFKGEHVEMPARNVIPKPLQDPHPPVWVACTRPSSVQMAAQKAIGALSFAYTGPEALKERVDGYYREFEEQGTPVTPAINPNLLAIGGDLSMMVAKTDEQALEHLGIGGGFFSFGIMHYYLTGMHTPGRTGVWELYEQAVKDDPTLAYGPAGVRSARRTRCASSCAATRRAASTKSSCCSTRAAMRHHGVHRDHGPRDPARVHRARREGGQGQGQAAGAGDREGRGAQAALGRTDVRRDVCIRRSATGRGGKFTAGEIPEAMAEINEGRVKAAQAEKDAKAAKEPASRA